jgi:hypothetical protein
MLKRNHLAGGRKIFHAASAVAFGLAAQLASAQDSSSLVLPGQPFNSAPPPPVAKAPSDEESDATGLGGRFAAKAGLFRTFTDNLYYAPDHVPRVKAQGWDLQPTVLYANNLPRLQLTAALGASLQDIDSPGQHDDSADATFVTGLVWTPFLMDKVTVGGNFQVGHDPFGTDRTEGGVINGSELDDWRLGNFALDWFHGSSIAGLSGEGIFTYTQKTYITNREFTSYLDYSQEEIEGLTYYALSPKTSLLLDLSASDIDFPVTTPGSPDQSGTLYSARAGVRWQTTAKLTGDLRAGIIKRYFNHQSQPQFTGIDWLASINWNPEPYRNLSLQGGQSSAQSYIASSGFIDTQTLALQWAETWTPLFTTRLVGNLVQSKFVNQARLDNNYYGGMFLTYQLTPALGLFATGAFGRRNSNAADVDYSRTDVFAGIKLSLSAE